jgi:hypothetical protein
LLAIATNVHGLLPAVEFKNFSGRAAQQIYLLNGEANTLQAGSKPPVGCWQGGSNIVVIH